MADTFDPFTGTEYHDLPYLPQNGLALPWFTATELLGIEATDITWLVDDLIPAETINLLIGSPGTGKSFLALDLALCVATGKPFIGRRVRQGRVMYLAAEDGWRRVARRLADWAKANRANPQDLAELLVMPTPIQVAAGQAWGDDAGVYQRAWDALQEDVARVGPVLVILDPLVDMHAGLEENDAPQMAGLMRALRKLVRGQDRSLLITHHDKKGVTEPGVYSGRGSSAISGAADGAYHAVAAADRATEVTAVTLHVTKGRDLPPALKRPLGLRLAGGHWYVDEAVRPSREGKALEENQLWYAWLLAQGGPVTVGEVAKAQRCSYNKAKAVLDRLVEKQAVYTDPGEYPAHYVAIKAAGDRLL